MLIFHNLYLKIGLNIEKIFKGLNKIERMKSNKIKN